MMCEVFCSSSLQRKALSLKPLSARSNPIRFGGRDFHGIGAGHTGFRTDGDGGEGDVGDAQGEGDAAFFG